ncbi:MAG: histidine phosphatase family protein [Deltaproteobacteria bacterium]|nr:histidine phosphatase family protein [Deltaproteobacteria bacterium]
MKVTFVRHAASEWAGTPRLLGRTDIGLSELGRQQVPLVAERLGSHRFDALWSSPLQRCRDTAAGIGERIGHMPVLDDRLLELDIGQLEGRSFAELPKGPGTFRDRWQRRPGTTRFPGGETIAEVVVRTWTVLEDLYEVHPAGHVLVVAHMFAISAALTRIFKLKPGQFRTFAVDPASLTTVQMDRGGFRLLQLNDTSHLGELRAPGSHNL